ncbi:hypothetical protein [Riemerella anatipestifer]|uniref:hypothetical protein n=1 Tax=Riemerella anatipestifer TaxID=34085 RepID=UPI0007ED5275|nr:hypothetical protein [Riemerella anatipestifer]AZZ57804.1 hypothetical protein AWB57_01380 [Riemerella anatipestifer]MCW0511564.1 hypothetical protein [Riemerella anatipestifer]MCW0520061.1 hypothetical protein [Riemerella anatipestifer]MDY3391343.1 hypothetical protein [Riemerella anatipestifer]MDY3519312.1 hypothetical protein [Riemerella anatipestifer]
MIQEVIAYKNVLNGIESLLDNSPFKKNYIIEQVGIPAPTFYRKLKALSFTPDEVLKILTLVKPQEALLYEIEMAENDYKNGRVREHKEYMKELRKKYL